MEVGRREKEEAEGEAESVTRAPGVTASRSGGKAVLGEEAAPGGWSPCTFSSFSFPRFSSVPSRLLYPHSLFPSILAEFLFWCVFDLL